MTSAWNWIIVSLAIGYLLPAMDGFKFNIDFDEQFYECIGQENISLMNYIDYSNVSFSRVSDKELEINGELRTAKLFPPKSKYSVSY